MATSNIKLFDENKGNMISDSEFSISNQRLNGLQTGVASSQLQNKAMYQASLVAYAIAQVMMQNGLNANDTDAVSTFVANLSGTMLQKVYDLATAEEAKVGVATGKWMSPALVKAAIDTLAAKAQNILSDTTKTLYGLDHGAVPNDVFVEIIQQLSENVNPNLLDNWYFGNPVNQRGQTSYIGEGYSVDRWCGRWGGDTSVVLRNGYIEISRPNYAAHFRQYSGMSLAGKTVTLSALCSRINMFFESKANGADYTIVKNSITDTSDSISLLTFTTVVPANSVGFCVALTSIVASEISKIVAVKLELGTKQTLAHKDANGNWVLNEITDYSQELLKCCMSTADQSDTYANNIRTAKAIGGSKIAKGSYTGTGSYGSGSQNSLTFDFEPKIVIVQKADQGTNLQFSRLIMIQGMSSANNGSGASNEDYQAILNFSGNTVSWYSTSALGQLNHASGVYEYVALG